MAEKKEKKNQPIKRVRAGLVSVAVWENEIGEGKEKFIGHSFTMQRSYKDKEGEWQQSQSFNKSDIPLLLAALKKAYSDIVVNVEEI